MTVKHSFPSFRGLSASIPYVLNYGKFTARMQEEEEVSGLITGLSSKSMLAPRETQLDGAPLILGLGRAPGDNKKVSTATRAASHLLSILFALTRGKQEEKEISGRKIRIPGETVYAYRLPLPFSTCSQKWEQKAGRQAEVTLGFPATHPSRELQPCPQSACWGTVRAGARNACREMFPHQDSATSAR